MINEKELDKFINLINFYPVGSRLNSIKTISQLIGINNYSTRKLINGLISFGIIEKYNNRFFIISKNYSNTPKDIQERLINKAKINLNILKLLQRNFIHDKKTVSFIQQDGMYFNIYFPINAKKVSLTISDIDNNSNIETVEIIKRCKFK